MQMSNNIDDILNVAAQDAVERIEPDNGFVRPIVISKYPRHGGALHDMFQKVIRSLSLLPFVNYRIISENSIEMSRLDRLQEVSMVLKILSYPYKDVDVFKFEDKGQRENISGIFIRTDFLRASLLFDSKDNAEVKMTNYFCWRSDIPKIASIYRLLLDGPVSNDEIVSELMSHHFGCLLGMAESELNERLVIRKWLFPCHIVKDELNFYENEELVGEKTVRFKEDVTNSQIFDDNPNCYEGAYTHAYIVTTREFEDKVFVRSILLILVDRSRGEDSHVCVVKKNVLYINDEKIFNDENKGILKKFFELCEKIGVHVPEADRIAIFDELVKTTKELNSKLMRNG